MSTSPSGESGTDGAMIIAFLLLLSAILGVLAFKDIPDKNMTLFASLASGVVGSSVGAYVGFRWGSSKGSQTKDATIAAMAPKGDPQ